MVLPSVAHPACTICMFSCMFFFSTLNASIGLQDRFFAKSLHFQAFCEYFYIFVKKIFSLVFSNQRQVKISIFLRFSSGKQTNCLNFHKKLRVHTKISYLSRFQKGHMLCLYFLLNFVFFDVWSLFSPHWSIWDFFKGISFKKYGKNFEKLF